jgi:hypothetical protein
MAITEPSTEAAAMAQDNPRFTIKDCTLKSQGNGGYREKLCA